MSKNWGSTRNTLLTIGLCSAFAALVACSDTTKDCAEGQEECDGKCVDLATDEAHCGKCGTTCDEAAGQICSKGKCACTGDATDCDGTCANLMSDPANCGECGKACADSEACSGGKCGGCAEPKKNCDGSCISVQTDNENCGDCGVKCENGSACAGGECVCDTSDTKCGDACVDTNSDPAHCGGCDTACPDGQLCIGGQCGGTCDAPREICDGICVNTQTDEANCGQCGTACEEANGFVCDSGNCVCAGNFTDCGGQCVDTTNNPAHCSACDAACQAGEVCANSACTADCPPGQDRCGGFCIDTNVNDLHCGGCDQPCEASHECAAGACVCPTAAPDECNNQCTDLNTDENNCGVCDLACTASQTCSGGVCTGAVITDLDVNCPQASVPETTIMDCTATGTLQGVGTVDLTTDPTVTWNIALTPGSPTKCAAATQPLEEIATISEVGQFEAPYNPEDATDDTSPGCKVDISAVYTSGSTTVTSNTWTVTITAKALQSISLSPADATVPWLQNMVIIYTILGLYDSGQTLDLADGTTPNEFGSANAATGSISNNGSGQGAFNFAGGLNQPTTNNTTVITAVYDDNGTDFNTQTNLTVAPGNVTALSIEPANPSIPLGPVDFTVMATFNNALQFDITNVVSGDIYTNFGGLTWAGDTTYFTGTGGPVDFVNDKARYIADQVTPANVTADVKVDFDDSYGNSLSATAQVTISDKQLLLCQIVAAPGDNDPLAANTEFPVGLQNQQFYVQPHYSDSGNTCGTDSEDPCYEQDAAAETFTTTVTWSSQPETVVLMDNGAGNEGQGDMLAQGLATITATDAASGVACSVTVKVVGNTLCHLWARPQYQGMNMSAPWFMGTPTGLTNAGDVSKVVVPNELGQSIMVKADALYSQTAGNCAGCNVSTGAGCFLVDVTSNTNTTWSVVPDPAIDPAVPGITSAGNGLFNVADDEDEHSRYDKAKAVYVDAGVTVEDDVDVNICGEQVASSATVCSNDMTSYDADDNPTTHDNGCDSTTVAKVAIGGKVQYSLVMQYAAGGSATCGHANPGGNYVLNVTEQADSWTPIPASIASVSNAAGTKGEITGVAEGTAGINAVIGTESDDLDVEVVGEAVDSCTINMPTHISGTLYEGGIPYQIADRARITATADLTNGTTADITNGYNCTDADDSTTCGGRITNWQIQSGSGYGTITDWNTAPDPDIEGGIVTGTTAGGTMRIGATCPGCGQDAVGPTNVDCEPLGTGAETPAYASSPSLEVKDAIPTGVRIQVAGMSCNDPAPAALRMHTGTTQNVFACVDLNNGAFIEVHNGSDNVGGGATAGWSGTLTITDRDETDSLNAVIGGSGVTATGAFSITFTYDPDGTGAVPALTTSTNVNVVSTDFTSFEVRNVNMGAAGCTNLPNQPDDAATPPDLFEGCALGDLPTQYLFVGLWADAEQILNHTVGYSFSCADNNSGASCAAFGTPGPNGWIKPGATPTYATLTFNAGTGVENVDGDTDISVDIKVLPAANLPNALTIAATPSATATGANQLVNLKVTGPTTSAPAVTLDFTDAVTFSHSNPLAYHLYSNTGDNGVMVSRNVGAAETTTLTYTLGAVTQTLPMTTNP